MKNILLWRLRESENEAGPGKRRKIRWTSGVKLMDKLSCSELRLRLSTEDIVKVAYKVTDCDGVDTF